tara:strand:+ start:79 stop:1401 length:1323 start_codon:yes stop_codon:yes gene_type:complete
MDEKLLKNFTTLVVDFTKDLTNTFPEYNYLWKKYYDDDATEDTYTILFDYCKKVYPERFFDILYQNNDIFEENNETNVYFLPNVSFRFLFNCEGITENTKKAIWKYLQLVLFTVVNDVKDKSDFGESMNIFDGIEESDLQDKLKETMESIGEFFSSVENNEDLNDEQKEKANDIKKDMEDMMNDFENLPNVEEMREKLKSSMPNIENLQDHLRGLFDGKIGSLAKEMAEEIADDFKDLIDENDVQNPQDVIKKLMKNPGKISELMKTVGSKLDTKMKNGEISKDELMKEATEMMGKMREMGQEGELNEMLKNMAKNMGGLGKNMRMDTNKLDRMTKKQDTINKMKQNSEIKKRQQEIEMEKIKLQQQEQINLQNELRAKYSLDQKGENSFVFKIPGIDQEKTFIHPDLLKEIEAEEKEEKESAKKAKAPKKKKKKTKGKK